MTSSPSRSSERRCSTRWRAPEGLAVAVRRVGRRTVRPAILWDASATGALIELGVWLPLGTMLQLSCSETSDVALVAVVRSDLGRDYERRYGVSCLQGVLPAPQTSGESTSSVAPRDDLRRWPAIRKDIRRHYRSMALRLHPDVGGSDERFCALHRAYAEAMDAAPH